MTVFGPVGSGSVLELPCRSVDENHFVFHRSGDYPFLHHTSKWLSQSAKAIAGNQARVKMFAAKLAPLIAEIRKAGVVALRGIAQRLNVRGFRASLGKEFAGQAVRRVSS